ncbi:hypothetical protein [Mumia sp. DW29H23]|uniref:hypothetical protein n=1 Tax=Mumia sp. DW29H23 TaxID=3421241 RepID=UPI003D69D166
MVRRGLAALALGLLLLAGCGDDEGGGGDGGNGGSDNGNTNGGNGGNGNGNGNGNGGNGNGAPGSPVDVPSIPDPGVPIDDVRDGIIGVWADACGGEVCVELEWEDGTCFQGFDPSDGQVDRGSTVVVRADDSCGGEETEETEETETPEETDGGDGETSDGSTGD